MGEGFGKSKKWEVYGAFLFVYLAFRFLIGSDSYREMMTYLFITAVIVITCYYIIRGLRKGKPAAEKIESKKRIEYEQMKHGRDPLPEFKVTIFHSGKMFFEGKANVRKGIKEIFIGSEETVKIFSNFEKMDFLHVDISQIPILPGSIQRSITYHDDKETHTITLGHYSDRENKPGTKIRKLLLLEKEINSLISPEFLK